MFYVLMFCPSSDMKSSSSDSRQSSSCALKQPRGESRGGGRGTNQTNQTPSGRNDGLRIPFEEFLNSFPKWVFPRIGVPPNHPFLIGFSIINHPFWGTFIFGNTQNTLIQETNHMTSTMTSDYAIAFPKT